MKNHTILECRQCHKKYEWMSNRGKFYCSMKCRNDDIERHRENAKKYLIPRKGKDNNRWSGGIHICIKCGKPTKGYTQKMCRKCYVGAAPQSEGHPNWVGENVDYCTLHSWVRRHLGKAWECVYCGKSRYEGKRIHWASISHKAIRDLGDYISLCASCHAIYDRKLRVAIR